MLEEVAGARLDELDSESVLLEKDPRRGGGRSSAAVLLTHIQNELQQILSLGCTARTGRRAGHVWGSIR